MTTAINCPDCNGTGLAPGTEFCGMCQGSGIREVTPTECQACRCNSYVEGYGCTICDNGVRENEVAAEHSVPK